MSLADIVDIMLKVKAGAYLFEAGNPRHEHEWKVWEDVKLEDGKLLVPGVISHSTPLVEHPELVAQRLVRFATIVGKENVIGGSDCASFAATEQEIHPTIVCGPSLPASRRAPASPPLPCIDTRGTGSSATSQPQKDPLLH
jgi:5-methyltetrahydropteroyltriglutamate--homocysteine methyltransferase